MFAYQRVNHLRSSYSMTFFPHGNLPNNPCGVHATGIQLHHARSLEDPACHLTCGHTGCVLLFQVQSLINVDHLCTAVSHEVHE